MDSMREPHYYPRIMLLGHSSAALASLCYSPGKEARRIHINQLGNKGRSYVVISVSPAVRKLGCGSLRAELRGSIETSHFDLRVAQVLVSPS